MVSDIYRPVGESACGETIPADAQHLLRFIEGADVGHVRGEQTRETSRARTEVEGEAGCEIRDDLFQRPQNISLMIFTRDQGFIPVGVGLINDSLLVSHALIVHHAPLL